MFGFPVLLNIGVELCMYVLERGGEPLLDKYLSLVCCGPALALLKGTDSVFERLSRLTCSIRKIIMKQSEYLLIFSTLLTKSFKFVCESVMYGGWGDFHNFLRTRRILI